MDPNEQIGFTESIRDLTENLIDKIISDDSEAILVVTAEFIERLAQLLQQIKY